MINGESGVVHHRDVTFASGDAVCAAVLYLPDRQRGDVACVVMASGYSGTRDLGLPAYAERFASNGMAVLAFDYAGFGSSTGKPRLLVDPRRQADDYRAAIRCARSTAGIDPERIVLWGVSLGGGHVLEVAADDARIVAVIALTPFVGMTSDVALRRPLETARLLTAGLLDAARSRLGLSPVMIPVIGEPGRTALVRDTTDRRVLLRLAQDAPAWRNQIRARGLLGLLRYRPGSSASRLTTPLLVGIALQDAVVSSADAAATAVSAPHGQLRRYAGSHFDCFENPTFESAVEDQVAFLRRHVPHPRP
ncbi:alpha/beta hydrolase [Actinosynnema sp. NPDC091369]